MRSEDDVGGKLRENPYSKEWSEKNALSISRLLAQTPPPFSQLMFRLLAPLSPCTKPLATLSPCFGHAGIVLAS